MFSQLVLHKETTNALAAVGPIPSSFMVASTLIALLVHKSHDEQVPKRPFVRFVSWMTLFLFVGCAFASVVLAFVLPSFQIANFLAVAYNVFACLSIISVSRVSQGKEFQFGLLLRIRNAAWTCFLRALAAFCIALAEAVVELEYFSAFLQSFLSILRDLVTPLILLALLWPAPKVRVGMWSGEQPLAAVLYLFVTKYAQDVAFFVFFYTFALLAFGVGVSTACKSSSVYIGVLLARGGATVLNFFTPVVVLSQLV